MGVIADKKVWRAELTVGTMHGYSGPEVVKPGDLIPIVQEFQSQEEPWYAVIVWTRGTVIGPTFKPEAVIKVTLESNPLYTPDATEEDITGYAVRLATLLAERLHQVRVYVSSHAIRSLLVEVQP